MSKHRKHIRRDEAHKKTVHIDLSDQIIPPFNANPKFDTVDFYGKEWELIPEPNPRDLEANWGILDNFNSEFSKIALGYVDNKDRHPITLEKLDNE